MSEKVDIEKQINMYLIELIDITKKIDDFNIASIQDKIYTIKKWLLRNDYLIKEYKINIEDIEDRLILLTNHVNILNSRRDYKNARTLTIINSIFLILGFTMSYVHLPFGGGPDKLMKSKNIELYFILFLITISLILFSFFYMGVL